MGKKICDKMQAEEPNLVKGKNVFKEKFWKRENVGNKLKVEFMGVLEKKGVKFDLMESYREEILKIMTGNLIN
jgi:hypothetical protein